MSLSASPPRSDEKGRGITLCKACGADSEGRALCVTCRLIHLKRRHQERKWTQANQWPASERGDKGPREGWEGMEAWEKAMGCHLQHETDEQRHWLKTIRARH